MLGILAGYVGAQPANQHAGNEHVGEQGCAPVPAGLSAWFTFDEELFRKPGQHSPQRVPGLVGSALKFNGKDQFVELPASTPGLDMGEDDFSIELWVRTADSLHAPSIVDKRDHAALGYLIFLYQGHAGLQVGNGGRFDDALAQSVNVAGNGWHHVAGVVKRLPPEHFGIYVDGVKQPQMSSRTAPLVNLDVPTPVWLGRHHANGYVPREDIYFEGEIDELSFYRRALTAAEIRSIFRAGARGKCRPGR